MNLEKSNNWCVSATLKIRSLAEANSREIELIHNYSRYKFGAVDTSLVFAHQLILLLEQKSVLDQIQQCPSEWLIITPPYSVLPSSVYHLNKHVAKMLGISHVSLRRQNVQSHTSLVQYAELQTLKERKNAIQAAGKMFIEAPVDGKKTLLMDDLITSGATLLASQESLQQKMGASHTLVYALVHLVTENFKLEEEINSYVLNEDLLTLIQILNEENIVINRHTLRSVMKSNMFPVIVDKLTPITLRKLYDSAKLYFSEHANAETTEKIAFLQKKLGE